MAKKVPAIIVAGVDIKKVSYCHLESSGFDNNICSFSPGLCLCWHYNVCENL